MCRLICLTKTKNIWIKSTPLKSWVRNLFHGHLVIHKGSLNVKGKSIAGFLAGGSGLTAV